MNLFDAGLPFCALPAEAFFDSRSFSEGCSEGRFLISRNDAFICNL